MSRRKSKSYPPCMLDIMRDTEKKSLQFYTAKHGVSTRIGQSLVALGFLEKTTMPLNWIGPVPTEAGAERVKEYASELKYETEPRIHNRAEPPDEPTRIKYLDSIPASVLVANLRGRGYEVKCTRIEDL